MLQKNSMLVSWGIGLSEGQETELRALLGPDHNLITFASGEAPSLEEFERDSPCVLWLSSTSCGGLDVTSGHAPYLDLIPRALLLNEEYALADFEKACDSGINEIVRPPFLRERVVDILRRAIEAQTVHHDLGCLTREVVLERELLERKNELLHFLVNFLTNTTESIDLKYLLQTAFKGLGLLLPIKALHMVLWEQDEEAGHHALSMYICAAERSAAHESWREALLEHARQSVGKKFSVESVENLHLGTQEEAWKNAQPSDGVVMALPIVTGSEKLGVLLVLSDMERHLGRDQAQALDSAMRHFALSVRNARRFLTMQMHADYDALTRVHSRRHFESRIQTEMQRFARYSQPLALIMLDIDNFKHINDTRGHHTGDLVLRQVAALLADGIRNTDYCARYGGEEFVILLPHSDTAEALGLAERMRKVIANHVFTIEGAQSLKLTVSMGVGCLTSGMQKNKQALVCEADAALYEAKRSGRNRVIVARESASLNENAM